MHSPNAARTSLRTTAVATAALAVLTTQIAITTFASAAPVTTTDDLYCATLSEADISEFVLDGRTTSVDYPATGAAASTVSVTVGMAPTLTNESASAVDVAFATYAVDIEDEQGRSVGSWFGPDVPVGPSTVAPDQDFPVVDDATFDVTLPGTENDRTYFLVPTLIYSNAAQDMQGLVYSVCNPVDNDQPDQPFTSAFPVAVTGVAGSSPRIALSPSGPFAGGEETTVVGVRFAPETLVIVVECRKGRPVVEPGDCADEDSGAATVGETDVNGRFEVDVTVVAGALHNATPPADSCGPSKPCVFVAFNLLAPGERAETAIRFKTKAQRGGTEKGDGQGNGDGSVDEPGGDGSSSTGGNAAVASDQLAATGSSPWVAVTALVLLQAGVVLVGRTRRRRPLPKHARV